MARSTLAWAGSTVRLGFLDAVATIHPFGRVRLTAERHPIRIFLLQYTAPAPLRMQLASKK